MFTVMGVSDIDSKIFHIKLQLPWVHFALNFYIHAYKIGSLLESSSAERQHPPERFMTENVSFI